MAYKVSYPTRLPSGDMSKLFRNDNERSVRNPTNTIGKISKDVAMFKFVTERVAVKM